MGLGSRNTQPDCKVQRQAFVKTTSINRWQHERQCHIHRSMREAGFVRASVSSSAITSVCVRVRTRRGIEWVSSFATAQVGMKVVYSSYVRTRVWRTAPLRGHYDDAQQLEDARRLSSSLV